MKGIDKDRTLNAVLYILDKMGGSCDMHKVFKILYFADQMHLSKYGRSITSDVYIAMRYGPVPSMTDDIFRAVRGDSYFSAVAGDLKTYFHFVNKFMVKADKLPDLDYLSASDLECLDKFIHVCEPMGFDQLTEFSHKIAWANTARDREMSVKDILREVGDTEDYAAYIADKLKIEHAF